MIGIIDYGMGNLSSVFKALKAVGAENVRFLTAPEEIENSSALILPGVGNFGDGMKNLQERGLACEIQKAVMFGKPLFGICLGMQLLMQESEEAPGVKGLEIFEGKVVKFSPELKLKVPQIGWNSVFFKEGHQCTEGVNNNEYFYFVHSYYVDPVNTNIVFGTTDYGINFCSCIAQNNVLATQFHPEKSQDAGLKLLKNFVDIVD